MSARPTLAARLRCSAALVLALASCALPSAPPARDPVLAPHLRLIGVAEIATGTMFAGVPIGGLSGIDYDAASDRYLMISDDRGRDGPARTYTARLRYDATRLEPPEWLGMQTLAHADGQPFAPWWRPRAGVDRPDAEAVRWLPGTDQFLWTSEGDYGRDFAPQLRLQNSRNGRWLADVPLPARFAFERKREPEHGPRDNGTLEGLALSPDGQTAWLAMERPWHQDGRGADVHTGGAPLRLTALRLADGRVLRQIAYPPDALPQARLLPGPQLNGISDILADGEHHLLVLERSYAAGRGFGARLYRIDTRSGSDTQALDALIPANHRPVAKTLIADLAGLGFAPDNLEGLTWGPRLPDGGCVLVFVSDNNFSPAQVTQFVAARYLEPPGGSGCCSPGTR